jgi:hypothetical protein
MNPSNPSTPRTRRATLLLLAAAAAVPSLAGCETSRYQAIKDDATPNLDTLHQRPEDIDNALVVTFDENGRMFWQDLGRAFYVDRPSRLTREPVPVP